MWELWSSFEQGTPPWINVYEIIWQGENLDI